MSQWLLYLWRWVVFAIHWPLALAYRALLLLSSQGSLLIVPILLALAYLRFHALLLGGVVSWLLEFRPGHVPGSMALDVVLAVLLAVASIIHGWLARLMSFRRLLLVPILAMLVVVWFRDSLHDELKSVVLSHPLRQLPDPPVLEAILVVLMVLAFVLYRPLSHLLEVVLGTFPPLRWPLPPVRPLRVKQRPITPVKVRLVVPRLPKRRWRLRLQMK